MIQAQIADKNLYSPPRGVTGCDVSCSNERSIDIQQTSRAWQSEMDSVDTADIRLERLLSVLH